MSKKYKYYKNIASVFFIISLFLLFSLWGCHYRIPDRVGERIEERKAPSWISQGSHIRYPDTFYLIGVGISEESGKAADDSARAELMKQIEVEIESRETSYQSESSQKKGGEESMEQEATVESNIMAKVNMKLSGIKISERWHDNVTGRFYSLATLEREIAASALKAKIEEELASIKNLYNSGQEYEKGKEKINALKVYEKAYNRRKALAPVIERYNVIGGRLETKFKENGIRLSEIEEGINRLKSESAAESYSWNDGLIRLAEQIVSGIRDEKTVRLKIQGFVDARSERNLILSNMLISDLSVLLARADALEVVETNSKGRIEKGESENQTETDFFVSGIYWLNNKGELKINAKLINAKNRTLTATGRVVIMAGEVNRADLQPIEVYQQDSPSLKKSSYEIALEKIYLTEEEMNNDLKVEVWTDKKKVKKGETLTIHFTSNRNSYIYILDIGTSGRLTVLFPNPFQTNNFVKAGREYSIPENEDDFTLDVSGPPGVERIKAIASLKPISGITPEKLNSFYSIGVDNPQMRDISVNMANLISTSSWAEDRTEVVIIQKGGESGFRMRSIRDKDTEKPQKPIDIIGTPGLKDR